MDPAGVVLYQKNFGTARVLAKHLSQHVQRVHLARTCEEIRPKITQYRARVLVLDLENSCLNEVKRLHEEFPALSIVCTHRLADDELWTAVLNEGAADICEPCNIADVVRSVVREQSGATASAAAA